MCQHHKSLPQQVCPNNPLPLSIGVVHKSQNGHDPVQPQNLRVQASPADQPILEEPLVPAFDPAQHTYAKVAEVWAPDLPTPLAIADFLQGDVPRMIRNSSDVGTPSSLPLCDRAGVDVRASDGNGGAVVVADLAGLGTVEKKKGLSPYMLQCNAFLHERKKNMGSLGAEGLVVARQEFKKIFKGMEDTTGAENAFRAWQEEAVVSASPVADDSQPKA